MLGKNLNEMNPHEIQITNNIILRTQDRLLDIYTGVTERAMKALFLINGGGVVAMLAYLHDSASVRTITLLISLACFLLGLVFTVIVVAIDYFVCLKTLNNYSANLKRLNKGEINLEEAQRYTSRGLSILTRMTIFMGYTAAMLFITGCIFAVRGFLVVLVG